MKDSLLSNIDEFTDPRSSTSRRRAGTKEVNYNEKKADAALAKQIRQLVKDKESQNKSSNGKITKSMALKRGPKNRKVHSTKFAYQAFLQDKITPWNFIPSLPLSYRNCNRFSTLLNTEEMVVDIKKCILSLNSNVVLRQDDHIYMVSEPPGDPYYIGRVVEFVPKQEYREIIESSLDVLSNFPAIYFQLRMNWYYRPRDIKDNHQNDHPRILYASLHNDLCPISSFRGKCNVEFVENIDSLEMIPEYISKPNNFYFNQLFDRYALKYYHVMDTKTLLSVFPKENYYFTILSKRYPFVFYEEKFPLVQFLNKYVCGKSEMDQSWDLRCGECSSWCHTPDSIKCDECNVSIHLYCMDPPLEKKPVKGVVWVCSNCMANQNNETHMTPEGSMEDITAAAKHLDKYARNLNDASINVENWWFQYIGEDISPHLKDCIGSDFLSPFPWKKSRINTQKSQWRGCTEQWNFRPYNDDSPDNFERGSNTELLWKMDSFSESQLDKYVEKCKLLLPPKIKIQPESCNFLDMVVNIFMSCGYNSAAAFANCEELITRKALREPTLTPEEVTKFEEAIAQHGSELHPVFKHVGTQSMAMIVRFYYYWKKTPNGHKIWGNFKGRPKNKKKSNQLDFPSPESGDARKRRKIPKPDNHGCMIHADDSSFDSDNISAIKTFFHCMFCSIDYSPLWYRVTGGSDDDHIHSRLHFGVKEGFDNTESGKRKGKTKGSKTSEDEGKLDALCIRCARMWRRYAIKWQSPLETLKKLYGSSSISLHAALTELLGDPNEQSFVCPKTQAFNKNVEWELVLDSEFISKQRQVIVENPERLGKMKKNTMAPHSQMNKVLKRPLDPKRYDKSLLKKRLENLIASEAEEKRKKDEKKYNRQRQRQIKEDLILEEFTRKPRKITEPPSLRNSPSTSENSIHEENSLERKGIQNAACSPPGSSTTKTFIKKILPNGDFVVHIPNFDSEANLLGKANIDSSLHFVNIPRQLSSNLFQLESLDSLQVNLRNHVGNASCIEIERPIENCSANLQVVNRHNIPIISAHSPLFHDSCRFYNFSNPFYHKFYLKKEIATYKNKNCLFIPNGKSSSGDETNSQNTSGCTNSTMEYQATNQTKSPRPFCCVCLSSFVEDGNDVVVCSNCGLNVHPHCYGLGNLLQNQPETSRKEWLCDPCSNDRNPIASTNYHCVLCNAREMDHDAAKNGLSRAIPDALKCEINGSWCHVLCAIFGKRVKFASYPNYQPMVNVRTTLLLFNNKKCDICSLSGGLLVQCDCCARQFHVTCCTDTSGYFVGFKKIQAGESTGPAMRKDPGSLFEPVIVCPDHQLPDNYLPLGHKMKGHALTNLQLYIKEKYDPKLLEMSPLQLKNEEQLAINKLLVNNVDDTIVTKIPDKSEPNLKKCCGCSSTATIFSNAHFCHFCDLEPLARIEDIALEKENDVEDIQEPKKDLSMALISNIDAPSLLRLSSKIKDLSNPLTKASKPRITSRGTQKVKRPKALKENDFFADSHSISLSRQIITGEADSPVGSHGPSVKNDPL